MSFAYDVKTELCGVEPENDCCKKSAVYGLLLFGRSFSPESFTLQTEHNGVVSTASGLLEEIYGVHTLIKSVERSDGHKIKILSLGGSAGAGDIYGSFGYDRKTVSLRINRAVFEDEPCIPAFLRGAFLSCGSVVDPEKDYHLEFVTPHINLGSDLSFLFREQGFEPKTVRRKGNVVVYFKDSSQIEDVLTLLGAVRQSLELMNVKVYKDLRNKVNRVTNCETANIEKTVNASAEQVEAIKKLIGSHGLDILPEDLREVAQLRLDNPDMSLRELGGLLQVPMSRSGVNHRLKKIMEMANRLNP